MSDDWHNAPPKAYDAWQTPLDGAVKYLRECDARAAVNTRMTSSVRVVLDELDRLRNNTETSVSEVPSADETPVYLSLKESRAIQRLTEQACQDETCGDAGCENIRRTVGAVKRLVARLAIIRRALDS